MRVRPKVMTVMCLFFGLLPIIWASTYETEADVVKRMATPMVGGLFTSFLVELTIYPAIFLLWKGFGIGGWRSLAGDGLTGPSLKAGVSKETLEGRSGWRRWIWVLAALLLVSLLAMFRWRSGQDTVPGRGLMEVVASRQIQDVQVQVLTPQESFTSGQNRFRLIVEKSGEDPLEVSDAKVEFFMPAMQAGADLEAIEPRIGDTLVIDL